MPFIKVVDAKNALRDGHTSPTVFKVAEIATTGRDKKKSIGVVRLNLNCESARKRIPSFEEIDAETEVITLHL